MHGTILWTCIVYFSADYKKELLKHIDAEDLPEFLGGKLTDSDGNARCASMVTKSGRISCNTVCGNLNELTFYCVQICQGGQIPEKYYLHDTTAEERMTAITVMQGNVYTVPVEVPVANTVLR